MENLFYCLCFVVVGYFVYTAKTSVIDTPLTGLVCNGMVKTFSSEHGYTRMVYANKLRAKKRTKRQIRGKHPDTKKWLSFHFAAVTGDCCWALRDKFNGGQTRNISLPDNYDPVWPIKAVELRKC